MGIDYFRSCLGEGLVGCDELAGRAKTINFGNLKMAVWVDSDYGGLERFCGDSASNVASYDQGQLAAVVIDRDNNGDGGMSADIFRQR